jgi:hypothetical protein
MSGQGVKLTPHPIYCRGQECVELHFRSTNNTLSWRGAQLKKKQRDNFTFTFTLPYLYHVG